MGLTVPNSATFVVALVILGIPVLALRMDSEAEIGVWSIWILLSTVS